MKTYLPLLLAAIPVVGICVLAEIFSRRRAKKHIKAVKPSGYFSFFGAILAVLGIVVLVFDIPKYGVLAILGGSFLLALGLVLLAVYFSVRIVYDEASCQYRRLFHKRRTYSYEDITGQNLIDSRIGNRFLLCFGSQAIKLNASMTGIDDFLRTAYHGYLSAKGLTAEEFPAPDPADLLWFPADDEAY